MLIGAFVRYQRMRNAKRKTKMMANLQSLISAPSTVKPTTTLPSSIPANLYTRRNSVVSKTTRVYISGFLVRRICRTFNDCEVRKKLMMPGNIFLVGRLTKIIYF